MNTRRSRGGPSFVSASVSARRTRGERGQRARGYASTCERARVQVGCEPRVHTNERDSECDDRTFHIFKATVGIPTHLLKIIYPHSYYKVVDSILVGLSRSLQLQGIGDFGDTYEVKFSPRVLVAIKMLSLGRVQQRSKLSRWRHSNLVTWIGYYGRDEKMFSVYNYFRGGNLENFLKEKSKKSMDWKILHKIALDCAPRILLWDVNPSNISLDNDFNAYLFNFGLARLLGNSETHATTGVAGTFGYVAPEYAMTCRVSDKADAYSYGVVLLELLSGKKVLDPFFSPYGDDFNIVTWASMHLRQTRAHEFVTKGLSNVAPLQHLIDTMKLSAKTQKMSPKYKIFDPRGLLMISTPTASQ
ncbi:hypothetical protein M5K25_014930 [Dendrobium thyrsiflorum]|uniref:Protein kinase domain-containing protein n=1 Tax=Dendrobium thyrsiflorum TaxID=117978 RepID=A0ABD0UPR8_DENTH